MLADRNRLFHAARRLKPAAQWLPINRTARAPLEAGGDEMTRTRLAGMIASLAGLLCLVVLLCMAVPAQSRATSQPKASAHRSRQATAAHAAKREFVPRIIGRANSFIVNGRIVALRGQRLGIEMAGGARLEFELSEQTT